jgi:mannose-6-phosphate isomerase-like protein (cupin superfamily)
MRPGDMIVIPKGVEHKPCAPEECHMMVIEPEGVLNTGNIENERTLKKPDWI